jgi:hypothetical protein
VNDQSWLVELNGGAIRLKLPLIAVFPRIGMWQRSESVRKAIDAPIYAIVKTTSKLAKDLVFGLWIPGERFIEDSRVRRSQRKFPSLNIVAERNLSALR